MSFDSAGGTVHADLLLIANIVPTLKLHHIGEAKLIITPAVDVGLTVALPKANCDWNVVSKHTVCAASEGQNQQCALGMTVTPTINIELDMDLDITLWHTSIYKKKFAPMKMKQKVFKIGGFPKCLVGSWSKSNIHVRRRRFLSTLSGVKQMSPRARSLDAAAAAAAAAAADDDDDDPLRSTVDGEFGFGIRDPNLADPRTYLQQRGANTQCVGDCNGNGFCVNSTSSGFSCLCQDGWTGNDCLSPVVTYESGISTIKRGEFPQPKVCGHGQVFSIQSSKEYQFLSTCEGRVAENFCASGDEEEMKLMVSFFYSGQFDNFFLADHL